MRIGTRGSDLALWQANHIKDLLAEKAGITAELVIIESSGDKDQVSSLADPYNASRYEFEVMDLLEELFQKHSLLFLVGGSGTHSPLRHT